MRVQILTVLSDSPKHPLIEFQSAYGIGRARWSDGTPRLFTDYDVEYEIPEMLVWGQTLVSCDEETRAVAYRENTLLLSGELERLDHDGCGYVRVGKSIILITIEFQKGYIPAHRFVQIISEQALIYDTRS